MIAKQTLRCAILFRHLEAEDEGAAVDGRCEVANLQESLKVAIPEESKRCFQTTHARLRLLRESKEKVFCKRRAVKAFDVAKCHCFKLHREVNSLPLQALTRQQDTWEHRYTPEGLCDVQSRVCFTDCGKGTEVAGIGVYSGTTRHR